MRAYLFAVNHHGGIAFRTGGQSLAQGAHDQMPSMKSSANQSTHNKQGMRAQMRDMLRDTRFTDIHVMPGSFVIHAKDKDGNPVVMNVDPNSFTEMTEVVGDNSRRVGTIVRRRRRLVVVLVALVALVVGVGGVGVVGLVERRSSS